MADVRILNNVVLSDPTTPSQMAAVDASGRLSVSLTASSATVTVDSELPAAAALSDNFANPTAPGVGAFGMLWDGATWDRAPGNSTDGTLVNLGANNDVTVTGAVDTELAAAAALADNTANPTVTSVGTFPHWYDGSTWDRALGNSTDGLLVNLGANNDVTIAGTVTVDSEMSVAAALTDNFANPTAGGVGAFLMGWDGATWDRVSVANSGRLQVDVITGGGADTPTNPINNYDTTASVAAGATDNHDTADFGAATKKVSAIIMGASVAMKGELQYVDNAVGTTLAVFFTQAGTSETFKPHHRNFWAHTFSATGGFDGFRLIRTNLDASEAADVYSVIQYED